MTKKVLEGMVVSDKSNKTIVVMISGGNIDLEMFKSL